MVTNKLKSFAEPLVESMGLSYWGAEYLSREALLRVYIDTEQGVSVEDCAAVSRELSLLLDVEDIIPSQYRLEVSSPGMRRPFFKLEQFNGFIGYEVKIKLSMPFERRKNFRGILSRVDMSADELGLIVEEEEYILPYELVDKANLAVKFEDYESGSAKPDSTKSDSTK